MAQEVEKSYCNQKVASLILAVRPVCALKINPVFIHSPGSVNGKQTKWH